MASDIFVSMPVQSILLVDDDPDDQFVFMDAVQSVAGPVEVQTASDGIDALEKLDRNKSLPHIIFLDLNMPRMNGKNFLREIKTLDTYKKIPVVIYSTSSNPSDIEETKRLGAAEFITKPTRYDCLCHVLEKTLSLF